MKAAGNEHVTGMLIRDRNHGSIASRIVDEHDPARRAILDFVASESSDKQP